MVDSQDLQLNISRETLQHNSQLRAIAKKIEKKITSELKKMRDNDREEYEKFFENFGRGLEFGIYNSYGMLKDQLADLLLFYSAKQEKLVTLDEYLEAAPADQKAIYYAAGESVERLAKMPIVKTVLGKGYDVLRAAQEAGDADKVKLYAELLYNQALLVEGLPIEDPVAYANAVTKLMA